MSIDYFANPPPGLDLTQSRTAANNAIGIVLFVSSLVFVGLRLYTRLRLKREVIGLDDYLMFLGLALNAGNLACCIAGGHYGLGKHIWTLDAYQMRQITIITFAYVFIYAWSVCVIKFSILVLYRRIFGLSWLAWFCVALTSGYLVTNHVVLPLYTRPVSYYWNQWYGAEGRLQINEAKFYLGVGIINLVGDVCILAVPVSNVLKLQMGSAQKIAICFMFLLGSFVCFASLYRIITITRLVRTTDISWAKSDVFIWSTVEPSVGIISGCLPTLRPLLYRMLSACGYTPSEHAASHGKPASQEPSALETISKKRTRRVGEGAGAGAGDTQFLESIDEGDWDAGEEEGGEGRDGSRYGDVDVELGGAHAADVEVPIRASDDHSRHWRLDDSKCSRTTVVQGPGGEPAGDEGSVAPSMKANSIVLTTQFEWDVGPFEGPADREAGR